MEPWCAILVGLQNTSAEAAEWAEQALPPAPPWAWLTAAGLLLLLTILVVQALARRRLYRGSEVLGPSSLAAVRAAIEEAEKRTIGEIVPVVLDRSDRYPAADLWSGILFALAAYLAAWALPLELGPGGLLTVALGAGLLGWLLSRTLPELRRRFVAPWRMTEMAEEQAFQEFFAHGLHRTAEQTGVLLFVSLFERRVVVMADEGIDAKVPPGTWKDVHGLVLKEAREGRLGAGLVAAVQRIADHLAEEFPWREGDRNELPDRVIVRPE